MSPPTNSKPELNQLMSLCWNETPDTRPSFSEITLLLDELLGDRPEEYLTCGDPDADILPNINSADNQEMGHQNFRYSYLSGGSTVRGAGCSSLAAQGYDRIADAHSTTIAGVGHHNSFQMSPLLSEIKSNPIPDTYQHLALVEPAPRGAARGGAAARGADRKDSAQYMNHETGMSPVIVSPDFTCGTENFVAQRL